MGSTCRGYDIQTSKINNFDIWVVYVGPPPQSGPTHTAWDRHAGICRYLPVSAGICRYLRYLPVSAGICKFAVNFVNSSGFQSILVDFRLFWLISGRSQSILDDFKSFLFHFRSFLRSHLFWFYMKSPLLPPTPPTPTIIPPTPTNIYHVPT